LSFCLGVRPGANPVGPPPTTQLNQTNMVIRVSRDNLASRAGTAKETLIRTLSDFKSEGLIDIDGGAISIQDLKKLQSMPQ
jgi:CRP-like cAMP-binding protein